MKKSLKLFVELNMATGGIGLAGTDHVEDQLLSHVSDHVIPKMHKKFAIELKVNYHHIEDDEKYSINKSLEVSRVGLTFEYCTLCSTLVCS